MSITLSPRASCSLEPLEPGALFDPPSRLEVTCSLARALFVEMNASIFSEQNELQLAAKITLLRHGHLLNNSPLNEEAGRLYDLWLAYMCQPSFVMPAADEKWLYPYFSLEEIREHLEKWARGSEQAAGENRVEAMRRIIDAYYKQSPAVEQLDLSGLQLTSLPDLIFSFYKLAILDLRQNRLTSLPEELRALNRGELTLFVTDNPLETLSPDLVLSCRQIVYDFTRRATTLPRPLQWLLLSSRYTITSLTAPDALYGGRRALGSSDAFAFWEDLAEERISDEGYEAPGVLAFLELKRASLRFKKSFLEEQKAVAKEIVMLINRESNREDLLERLSGAASFMTPVQGLRFWLAIAGESQEAAFWSPLIGGHIPYEERACLGEALAQQQYNPTFRKRSAEEQKAFAKALIAKMKMHIESYQVEEFYDELEKLESYHCLVSVLGLWEMMAELSVEEGLWWPLGEKLEPTTMRRLTDILLSFREAPYFADRSAKGKKALASRVVSCFQESVTGIRALETIPEGLLALVPVLPLKEALAFWINVAGKARTERLLQAPLLESRERIVVACAEVLTVMQHVPTFLQRTPREQANFANRIVSYFELGLLSHHLSMEEIQEMLTGLDYQTMALTRVLAFWEEASGQKIMPDIEEEFLDCLSRKALAGLCQFLTYQRAHVHFAGQSESKKKAFASELVTSLKAALSSQEQQRGFLQRVEAWSSTLRVELTEDGDYRACFTSH